MSSIIKITGGAQIGWMNATWPFAKLNATAQQLTLGGMFLGSFKFSPKEVAAIEEHGSIPIIGKGIRIIHTKEDYPDKMIFWCFGSPQKLINKIKNIGFMPDASLAEVPSKRGIPVTWSFIIIAVIIWNALFALDMFIFPNGSNELGLFSFLALLLVFISTIFIKQSKKFQALVLKPDRSIKEIKPTISLLQFISGVMVLAFVIQYFAS